MDFGFGMMPSEKERSAQRLSLIRRMQGMNSMMAAERETSTRGGMGHSMTSHPAPVEVGVHLHTSKHPVPLLHLCPLKGRLRAYCINTLQFVLCCALLQQDGVESFALMCVIAGT